MSSKPPAPPAPPSHDFIRYDLLTEKALRGVVRDVLSRIARDGVPGDHHFLISFRTSDPEVRLSQRLRAQHPAEMTIVLQHQFWDLDVTDDRFEVGLSFKNVPERLVVPFASLTGFFDPSVQFGLKFDNPDAVEDLADAKPAAPVSETAAAPAAEQAERRPESVHEAGGAEVVSLDKFRKK